MKITLFVELGDDETPLGVAKRIEEELQRLFACRKVLMGDGTSTYTTDDRKVAITHFEA